MMMLQWAVMILGWEELLFLLFYQKLIPIILLTKVENNTNKQSACCQYQSNEVRHELNILSSFSFILAMVRIVVFADS